MNSTLKVTVNLRGKPNFVDAFRTELEAMSHAILDIGTTREVFGAVVGESGSQIQVCVCVCVCVVLSCAVLGRACFWHEREGIHVCLSHMMAICFGDSVI